VKRGIDLGDGNRSSLLVVGADDGPCGLVALFKINLLHLVTGRVQERDTGAVVDFDVSAMISSCTRRAEPPVRGEPCRSYSIPT
jgi:hypothetical protein